MMGSLEENQPNNNPEPSTSPFQGDPTLIPEKQDMFCFLKKEEKLHFSPSFFSQNGLSQDIIEVTDAEPDICLEVFYALYHALWPQIEKQSNVSLKDAWKNFIGSPIFKGILCPPEKLIGKKKPKDIKRMLSENQGEHQVFQDLDFVVKSILDLKQKVVDYPDQLLQKEEILESLDLIEGVYRGYRHKVMTLVQAMTEKEQINVACVSEYDALVDLLESKAVMMSEIFTGHWAYRIPRNKAQKLLSLDENRCPIFSDLNEPSSHRVAALPEKSEAKDPLVYFKANGNTPIQPEKEFMLYSLYKNLKIPVPETALLILTNVFQEGPDYYYAVQASEAVVGQPAAEAFKNQETIFEEEAFVKQVIGALLTNPSDGSFKNFKYNSKYKTLISIDNDLVFEPELTGNEVKAVNIKSVLYLLPLMDKPISGSIQTYFTTLDSHLIMLAWLKDLDQKNKEYSLLFARLAFQKTRYIYQNLLPQNEIHPLAICLQQSVQVDSDLENDFFSPLILLSKNLFHDVSEKLRIIEKTFLNNRSVSSQILLEEISSILGKYYHEFRLEFSDPEEALDVLWTGKKAIASSLLSSEGFGSLRHNKKILDENLLPEMFFKEYKSKLISGERLPFDKFIQRHSQRKLKKLLDLSQVVEELRLLKREELTDSQSLRDIVDFCYSISKTTGVEDHLRKEIVLLFSSLPDAELKWLLTLEKYFLRADDVSEDLRSSSFAINGAFLKQRMFALTESAKQEIFDEQGNIKKDTSLTGRSNVTGFPKASPEFYLKQYPEWPGYEFASILFMRLMGISQLPYQDLLIMEGNPKYPALLTQKVGGDPVFQAWQDPKAFINLDPCHTGLLIIAAMLINPEDGKEDNFLLSKDGKFLIPIDNDHCFLPSTYQKGAFWNIFVNTALQTKTFLFCLDEMNKPVPNEVKQSILSIDFDLLLKSWMKELIKIEDRYNYLVDQEQRNAFLENGTVLRIPFYEQFIHNLYWKANKIQDLLRSTSEQTPLSLLKAVEPFAARCYQDSFQYGDTLQSRFKAATDKLYLDTKTGINGSRASVLNTRSMMRIINISEKDLQNDASYHKMGPSDVLELLKMLTEERSQKIKMEQDLLCEIDDNNEGGIWTTLFGNPLLETALNNFFSNPKEGLVLKGSKLITRSKLTDLFAQTPDKGMRIRFLSLPESPLLTDKEIRILTTECTNLEYLNVSGCGKLNEIVIAKEEWPLLVRLEAKGCLKLERLISESPMKTLRIGTESQIDIVVEKSSLDVFTILTKASNFEFSFRKAESLEIKLGSQIVPTDNFLRNLVLAEEEEFEEYFRDWKIIGRRYSILSGKDLGIFVSSLNLTNSDIQVQHIQRMIQLNFINLKRLELSLNQLKGINIIEHLIQGKWPKLGYLDLSYNGIDDEGLAILCKGNWNQLEILDLSHTKITKKGLLNFALDIVWPNLREIRTDLLLKSFQSSLLRNNRLFVEELDLSFCQVSQSEIEIFVNQCNFPQLKYLNLSRNNISDRELEALAQGKWPLLETVDLSHTKITKKGLLNFTLDIVWPNLRQIIFDPSLKDCPGLLLQKNLPQLEELDLSFCEIAKSEIERIITKFHLPQLKYLNLSGNHLTNEGLKVIGTRSNWI